MGRDPFAVLKRIKSGIESLQKLRRIGRDPFAVLKRIEGQGFGILLAEPHGGIPYCGIEAYSLASFAA